MSATVKHTTIVVGVAVCLGLGGLTGGAMAQELKGRVLGAGGRPLRGAEVGMVDGVPKTTANDSGLFVLTALPAGRWTFFARAIGYRSATALLVIGTGSVEHSFELQSIAIELPELKAVARWAKPARLAHTTKYDEFYRRRKAGLGSFLTRDDIEQSSALRSFELLRMIPGIQVTWNPPGVPGTTVRFTRCNEFPIKVSVWIDGQKQILYSGNSTSGRPTGGGIAEELRQKAEAWEAWLGLFDVVKPSDIEAMEVFRGVAQIPAEFLDDSCAAVVIWTKEGGRRGDR